ncbi:MULTISPECIES: NUDIX hydrolase [Bradyrhizobium]|uniref:NUDIX hydrolase n=1 Tax=Bradyrhizobium TaxID=374 RepID=UPI00155EB22A|nr:MULTISPECIES: NUDIX hydrolase [Bradyrhizobium]MDD1518929.1 NUDIX hydrolase [Bradyrhizobium sp. WBAH30]MDD1541073.1 NUDIX hydrolase [Bradyrhizobium sp. WBAH41]MDD1557303.1 NUDIX hydrolase [Bradyrhizobium sp. WBAH23]MDD1563708.1 NUDIX hydrolase [Bradyrhizobium sp. WBAH33]MDD1590123.1 NUDIX hydrolase [Bradyrhizobium sp. WBAH42]
MGKKQFAALPFRLDKSELRVMLITTRRKRRWSVPKGSPMHNKEPHLTAALEAYEEAGLVGVVATRALGSFKHRKRIGDRKRTMNVAVFPMKVHGRERWWPEKGEREAIWVSPKTAARLVHKAQLRRLIARFAAQTVREASSPTSR